MKDSMQGREAYLPEVRNITCIPKKTLKKTLKKNFKKIFKTFTFYRDFGYHDNTFISYIAI